MATTPDDEVIPYYQPVWLQGLRDPTGMLKEKTETNAVVENTEIVLDGDIIDFSAEEKHKAQEFMQTISRLRGLKSIRFLPEKYNKIYLFPVRLLTCLLQSTPDLQMFSLCAVEMYGSNEEFVDFLNKLRRHPSLRLVRLIRCRFPDDENTTTTSDGSTTATPSVVSLLDPLITSLSEIRNLKELELTPSEVSALGTMSDESWTRLIHHQQQSSPSLEKIRLENWEFSQGRMLEFFAELQNNNQLLLLKGVYISSCELAPEGLRALATVLGNNGTLEELSVCLTYNRNQFSQEEERTLDDDFVAIAQSLEENTSMRQFRLSGSNQWPKFNKTDNRVQQSFLQMLRQRNSTLEVLSLFDDVLQHDKDIDFLLALNRMGRKRVMNENATKLDWLEIIENSRVDLNCLYYFLSMKPELLDGTTLF